MDLLRVVPAPMPDICVRLWKNCPRPASHVVPRLTDRLHRDRTAILMRPPCVPLVRLHSTPTAKTTFAVLHAFLWFASIRVRLWKTAAVRQVASIATMRKSSGRKPTPPCVPLVRLHSRSLCIATCAPLRVSWFANHPLREPCPSCRGSSAVLVSGADGPSVRFSPVHSPVRCASNSETT